jgi:hypothetical protein
MVDIPFEAVTLRGQVTLDTYSRYSPRFVVVLDADALLSSVDNHCRSGRSPRLLRIADSSDAKVYAADHVYGEA